MHCIDLAWILVWKKNTATKDIQGTTEKIAILRDLRLCYGIIANFPKVITVFWLFRRKSLFLEMLFEINRGEVSAVFDLLVSGSE